jgi:WD40 repeat protein
VIWDVQTGKALRRLLGHASWVTATAWSPDGTRVATGSADHTVRLWDASTGQVQATLPAPVGVVNALGFLRGGQLLAAGGGPDDRDTDPKRAGYGVRVWSVASGAELATFKGHHGNVVALRQVEGGKALASAALDETVRVWQLPP